ncbi:MAG: hypothetical protein JJE17_03165, partial [Peptostreptococcaceae bacterium]|nr:hypothetical protein [Peptostreptococcaceae bacterium]
TETVSDGLDLITNVKVDKANTSDTDFVIPGIIFSQQITKDPVEKVYADGAYQRTVQEAKNAAFSPYFWIISVLNGAYNRKRSRQLSILPMLFFIIDLINF